MDIEILFKFSNGFSSPNFIAYFFDVTLDTS